jgi:hypothetical protein
VSVWLLIGALLTVACVVVVALPFLRQPLAATDDRVYEPDARERDRIEVVEERDRALAALKELEFDHRTGKVSDEDYREQVGPLRRRAADALRRLDEKPRARAGARAYSVPPTAPPPSAADEEEMTPVAVDVKAREGRSRRFLGRRPMAVVDPAQVPEPMPVPSEPPGPVTVPEPSPVPSEPPMPVPAPDPMPEPSPPQPEPPPQARR